MITNIKPYASFNKIPVLVDFVALNARPHYSKSIKDLFNTLTAESTIKTLDGKLLDTYSKFQKFFKNKRSVTLIISWGYTDIERTTIKVTKFF